MPRTMPKSPTPTTRPRRWFSYTNIVDRFIEKHRPGETGRQLAERLRAERAVAIEAALKPKPRKSRAKLKEG